MTMLITGATGFISRWLLQPGERALMGDRLARPTKWWRCTQSRLKERNKGV